MATSCRSIGVAACPGSPIVAWCQLACTLRPPSVHLEERRATQPKWISVPVYGAGPCLLALGSLISNRWGCTHFILALPSLPIHPGPHGRVRTTHSVDHVSALFEGYFYFYRRLRVTPLDRHANEPKLGPHRPWATEPSKTGFWFVWQCCETRKFRNDTFIGPEPWASILLLGC
ncbi:hypothetical protein EDB92DRAFT_1853548 [Lactarius akahatsu]|uniref:Uncharacterized protein n=1 Tax=Lactarius akahatsu TaxID=416441 RepID=A0AAD4LN73_9AGAM|nr:hypothetical protein EDB92DRAFT_1853548 [Lactarius akahatsu]